MSARPFHLISDDGNTLFLARWLEDAGAPVTLDVISPAGRHVGRGLVPLAGSSDISRDAVVIYDGIGHGTLGRFLRGRGQAVIGGNLYDRTLELDRLAGAAVMTAHDIEIPPTHAFPSIRAAQAFLENHPGAWFVKVSGNQAESLTHNAPTAHAMIRYLEWAKGQPGSRDAFELQRKVTGTEISCEAWFDGQRFVPPYNCTFETKKFLTGDLGPRTGCEANVVWMADEDSPLHALTVLRLEDTLRRKGYVGPLDINLIVTDDGVPYGLEWSARLGFDASAAYLRLLKAGTLADQLASFAEGTLERWELEDPEALSLTLRVTTPPYPVADSKVAATMRGLPLDPRLLEDPLIAVDDVMRGPDGLPVLAGRDGFVGTVGAVGRSLPQLRYLVLDLADALEIPSKQHRTDVLLRAEDDWARLAIHDYVPAWLDPIRKPEDNEEPTGPLMEALPA